MSIGQDVNSEAVIVSEEDDLELLYQPGKGKVKVRAALTENLEDLRELLRSVAISRDFFTGYSLGVALQERIDDIGERRETLGSIQGADLTSFGKVTLQAKLALLQHKSNEYIQEAIDIITGQKQEAEKTTEGP